jgi:hypothetical protein
VVRGQVVARAAQLAGRRSEERSASAAARLLGARARWAAERRRRWGMGRDGVAGCGVAERRRGPSGLLGGGARSGLPGRRARQRAVQLCARTRVSPSCAGDSALRGGAPPGCGSVARAERVATRQAGGPGSEARPPSAAHGARRARNCARERSCVCVCVSAWRDARPLSATHIARRAAVARAGAQLRTQMWVRAVYLRS